MNLVNPVKFKLRVVHYPQVGYRKSFNVDVENEIEAYKIIEVLSKQHLWLFENNIIPDYSNVIFVEQFDDTIDPSTGKIYGWSDYYNDEECMDWDEYEEVYLKNEEE